MLADMSSFEAAAYAQMLKEALARREQMDRVPVRLPMVASYARLEMVLREWESSAAGAVLLRDSGSAVRVPSVAQLQQADEPWPPRGVLAAADGTWVLEPDGRVTRMY